jgi:hypothetical protein
MALPILESPKYSVTLPSTGKIVEYRPFLVKEEKILLIAQESESNREMISAMKDIVKACTFDKVDPNSLTSFDLEYIFLKLRTKSVGETSTVKLKCANCETFVQVEVNLDDAKITPEPITEPVNIMLTANVGVTMRYIRVRDLALLTDEKKGRGDLIANTVIASIASIYDTNGVYLTDDSTKEELNAFVNSLNREQMTKIETFIGATPKIGLNVNFKCTNPKCNHMNEISLNGIQSFFD